MLEKHSHNRYEFVFKSHPSWSIKQVNTLHWSWMKPILKYYSTRLIKNQFCSGRKHVSQIWWILQEKIFSTISHSLSPSPSLPDTLNFSAFQLCWFIILFAFLLTRCIQPHQQSSQPSKSIPLDLIVSKQVQFTWHFTRPLELAG